MKKTLLYLATVAMAGTAMAAPATEAQSRMTVPSAARTLRSIAPFSLNQTARFESPAGFFKAPAKAPLFRADEEDVDYGLLPAKPTGFVFGPGDNYGEIMMEWNPVTTNANGDPITGVTYTIARAQINADMEPVAEGLTDCSYTVVACPADAEQTFEMYGVFGVTDDGIGEGCVTGMVPVGAPYTMPFNESFLFYTAVGMELLSGEPTLEAVPEYYFPSQDQDGKCMLFTGSNYGDSVRLFTGRITIDSDATHPAFSFFYYCFDLNSHNTVQVQVNDGNGYVNVGAPINTGAGNLAEWNRTSVDLSAYKGKSVQIALVMTGIDLMYTAIDNMSLTDAPERDLTVRVVAPEFAAVGDKITLTAHVDNFGAVAAQDYSVDFFVNDVKVGTQTGEAIEPGARETLTYEYTIGPDSDEIIPVHAYVNFNGDVDGTNNTASPVYVKVERSVLPAVANLDAQHNDGTVTLSWSAPKYENVYTQIKESFEDYDSFATINIGNKGDWKFVDKDGGGQGSFAIRDIPNVTIGEPGSFIVFDNSVSPFTGDNSVLANTGNKFLAALYNSDKKTNDDWAISPQLCGEAQTITFYARAYDSDYPETLELLYSTTDDDPASFKSIRVIPNISHENYAWTAYTFDVPKGAQYFAFRFISTWTFMLFIDDVVYAPAGSSALALEGYNIYRDGVKLNDTPITDTKFVDNSPVMEGGYVVTAKYSQGESAASNRVYPLSTGIENVMTGLNVRGIAGAILVSGAAQPYGIYDLQGRAVYNGMAERVELPAGAYIVRMAGMAFKVLVK